jgi:hypothetical protein
VVTVDDTADVDTVHWKGNSVELLFVVKTFCAGGRTKERGAEGDGCGEHGGRTSFSSWVVCCKITDDWFSLTAVLFWTMPPPAMRASTRWSRCCSQPVVLQTATVHVVATLVGGSCRDTKSGCCCCCCCCGLVLSQHGAVRCREGGDEEDEDEEDAGSVVKCCCMSVLWWSCRLLLLLPLLLLVVVVLVLWNT